MIVGSGFIAKSIAGLNHAGITLFASGVADSGCVDEGQFERERSLIERYATRPEGMFVYFSTCRISGQQNSYFAHKTSMEEIVSNLSCWLVLRLPPVAGLSINPCTLFNFLKYRIVSGERFTLKTLSRRFVIGVDEMISMIDWILDTQSRNEAIDIVSRHDYSIGEIVESMEMAIGKKALYDTENSGERLIADLYRTACSPVDFGLNYIDTITKRYYS